jgi:hypothetical protein
MPGPVSDSYDPEWGTSTNGARIETELALLYDRISGILGHKPPLHILELVDADLPTPISATFTEKEWRLLRFALERAGESL